MAKKKSSPQTNGNGGKPVVGNGGEPHQRAAGSDARPTTNQGVVMSDDQNTLTVGPRGPQLLEDFVLRDKITHFDHERIPERVVHARGYGAHGYFQPYKSHSKLTKSAFLQDPNEKTPVFVRFSTVAGSAGSPDTARDVRGFAVNSYTSEAAAVDWLRDAFGHLKVIGSTEAASRIFDKASVNMDADDGLVKIDGLEVSKFIERAKDHRVWDREPSVRSM